MCTIGCHSKQSPINRLEKLSEEIQNNAQDYTKEDWKASAEELELIEDEIEQYYADFSADFIEPERRDAELVLISNEDIANNIVVSEEEIAEFYQDNISDYEQPETRHVLQMLFEDEKNANKAFFELKSGKGFLQTAADLASQSSEDSDFGYVSKDMLIEETQEQVFALAKNEFTNPIETPNGWQILQVVEIVPMKKMAKAMGVENPVSGKDFIASLDKLIADVGCADLKMSEEGITKEELKQGYKEFGFSFKDNPKLYFQIHCWDEKDQYGKIVTRNVRLRDGMESP